ncbi:phage tail protein [Verminephrobacter aporrectodeae subsp. tuberculatae]|uniref:Phage tail protein n=1 Tax=Verminephrobacter aporrectodeae subsp. tuberculatae TaxID=1110392 RepID=A0ABT3KQF4_9BURK|nr:phage tail protein [Verminephrobacter aporrectodeae]MCW5320544.1 phage tail protein [Verminephrobacter aporrectodeae subsp. tuberculatae]
MLKPPSLRAHLARAVPKLKKDPDRLVVLARAGRLQTTGTGSLSFEYAYTLQVVVLDYAGHADAITVPILAWVAVNQPEIFDNPERREKSIRFEVEYQNASTVDLSVEIDLTERVLVRPRTKQAGAYDITHVGEPPHPAWPQQREEWSLWLHDEKIAEWAHDPRPVL